jgi:hypothetical protein
MAGMVRSRLTMSPHNVRFLTYKVSRCTRCARRVSLHRLPVKRVFDVIAALLWSDKEKIDDESYAAAVHQKDAEIVQ